MIRFACPCGRSFQCGDDYGGRELTCPSCQQRVRVPGAPPTAPPAMPIGMAVEPLSGPVMPIGMAVEPLSGPAPPPPPRYEEDEDRRRPARYDEDEERRRPRYAEEEPRPRAREEEGERAPPAVPDLAVRTSGKAVAALVLGLVSLVLCGLGALTAIPAIVFGLVGLTEVRRNPGRLTGGGLALAGLLTGAVALVLWPILIALGVLKIFDVGESTLADANLRRIGSGMQTHQERYGGIPPDAIRSKDGQAFLSWRVALLPSLYEDGLFRQFRLDEPWDSPTNKALLSRMPLAYGRPGKKDDGPGLTYYRAFVGPGTAFEERARGKEERPLIVPGSRDELRLRGLHLYRDFPDGLSNTILVVEAAEAVPWTKPDELPYDPNRPLPKLGGHRRLGSAYSVLLADGSVRTLSRSVSEKALRAAITRNGGEVLGRDW